MESKTIATLVKDAVTMFQLSAEGSKALTTARKERTALVLASIKVVGPQSTAEEHDAAAFAFFAQAQQAGMSVRSATSRKSEFRTMLEHSEYIEDGATSWRGAYAAVCLGIKPESFADRLDREEKACNEQLEALTKRLDEIAAMRQEYLAAKNLGVIETTEGNSKQV